MPEDISSSQADTESVVQAAVSPFCDVSGEKIVRERGKESPARDPEGLIEEGDVCETEAGTEADVEDEDNDVVSGVDEVGVSRFECEGFTLFEVLRRKKLAKKSVFVGVVDTAHLPQCEFSDLRHLPLTFLLEIFCWPVLEFY